jgi:hypothetical protein
MTELPHALSNSASLTSYAALFALWKAGTDGRLVCDPEFLMWTANVRLHLTSPELEFFDKHCEISEYREQRIARLRDILMVRYAELVDQKRAANGVQTSP